MKHCIPPALKARVEASETRKQTAIERLQALAVDLGALEEAAEPDPFLKTMQELIEADKKVIQMRRRA